MRSSHDNASLLSRVQYSTVQVDALRGPAPAKAIPVCRWWVKPARSSRQTRAERYGQDRRSKLRRAVNIGPRRTKTFWKTSIIETLLRSTHFYLFRRISMLCYLECCLQRQPKAANPAFLLAYGIRLDRLGAEPTSGKRQDCSICEGCR